MLNTKGEPIQRLNTPHRNCDVEKVGDDVLLFEDIIDSRGVGYCVSEDQFPSWLPRKEQCGTELFPCTYKSYIWACRAWIAVYYAYKTVCGTKENLYDSPAKDFVYKYAGLCDKNLAIKWLKYHLSYLFAYGTHQEELPSRPAGMDDLSGILAGGWIYKCSKRLLVRGRQDDKVSTQRLYSLLLLKKGLPEAGQKAVDDAMKTHRQVCCQHSKPILDDDDQILQETILDNIDALCAKLFKGKVLEQRNCIPSVSSSYGNSLGNGGALTELLRIWRARRYGTLGMTHLDVLKHIRQEVLVDMIEEYPGQVKSYYATDIDEIMISNFHNFIDKLLYSGIGTAGVDCLSLDETRLIDICLHRGKVCATTMGIKEPLKVRLITKGDSAYYYRCLDLQKLMHSTVRKYPIFGYIGHPVDEVDFDATFGLLKEAEMYVSGDYSAATDNLNPLMIERVWDAICMNAQVWKIGSGLPGTGLSTLIPIYGTKYWELGRSALVQHLLGHRYEVEGKPETFTDDQNWGQMMGSPMSFPILNIINLCATAAALDWDVCDVNLPCRTNGDDIAFICRRDQYKRWCRSTGLCGLERSLGKNYTSEKFLVINSELRWRSPRASLVCKPKRFFQGFVDTTESLHDPEIGAVVQLDKITPRWVSASPLLYSSWQKLPYVNLGLLFGRETKGINAGRIKEMSWNQLGPRTEDLLKGHKPEVQDRLMKTFLEFHSEILSFVPATCNYYVPLCLGGVGLSLPDGWSRFQKPDDPARRRTSYFLDHVRERLACPMGENDTIRVQYQEYLPRKSTHALRPIVPGGKSVAEDQYGSIMTELLSGSIQDCDVNFLFKVMRRLHGDPIPELAKWLLANFDDQLSEEDAYSLSKRIHEEGKTRPFFAKDRPHSVPGRDGLRVEISSFKSKFTLMFKLNRLWRRWVHSACLSGVREVSDWEIDEFAEIYEYIPISSLETPKRVGTILTDYVANTTYCWSSPEEAPLNSRNFGPWSESSIRYAGPELLEESDPMCHINSLV